MIFQPPSIHPKKHPVRRPGLTLMELVVVLAVLVALAAVVVPMFPNLLRRAHKSVDATQSQEIVKAMLLYQGMYTSYPNEFDLMTVSTGTTAPDFLPADGGNPFGAAAQIGNLTDPEVAALRRVGVTLGHHFVDKNPAHPTMDPYANTVQNPTALSTSSPVFIIDSTTTGTYPVEIKNIIARDNTARFVVFGVGPRCTAVGTVLQNAPTSVPQNKDFTPDTLYSRTGVIFMVAGNEVTRTERARLIAAVALEDDELESTEKDLVGYYRVAREP